MMTANPLISALRTMHPELTERGCERLAAEVVKVVEQGLAEGRNFEDLELMIRGGKVVSPLAAELKRLRAKLGLNRTQVASATDWSVSKILRIEEGDVGISKTDARFLLDLYGVTDEDMVKELLKDAGGPRSRQE